jgi:2-polyprenyl-6-methoxyphenol hydroxylase-like FAD-dependent oxidoreductase
MPAPTTTCPLSPPHERCQIFEDDAMNTFVPTTDSDVLVVGAGPTGLMLANQLARQGVRTRIIDRRSGPSLQTKALGVQARTLEIYAQLGIADEAIRLGKRATGANVWTRGRRSARIPLGDIGQDLSPHPFLLILGQDDNERLLADALRRHGVEVQWDTELVGLAQEDTRAKAALKHVDGTVTETAAAWIAGCDGAHSAVRKLCGIDFAGAPYEQMFYVADVQATGAMAPDELNVYLWQGGFDLFFPMRGEDHWRLVGIVPPHLEEQTTFDDVAPGVREHVGAQLSLGACDWYSTYRVHHRAAVRFRDRRCFLLGDAAHVHSPVGAQGMNTGLQDAYNLGWKLALVVSGAADEALLDSYEQERLPLAKHLLSTTDRAFSLFASDSRAAGLFRTRVLAKVMAFAMGLERMRTFAFRTISQIGIRYPHSALSQNLTTLPHTAPRAGDRFPWLRLRFRPDGPVEDLFEKHDDTRFNLLVIGQPVPTDGIPAWGDRLRIHTIASDIDNDRELARARIPQPSFYLLRPDGHIGLAGRRLDAAAVASYASQRLRTVDGSEIGADAGGEEPALAAAEQARDLQG